MSTTQPKPIRIDSSERPVSEKKILAEGEVQTLDSSVCALVNDTSNTYIVFMRHDDEWIAQIWGQPPGMTVTIPPTWKVDIVVCDGNDFYWGDASGSQKYGANWILTTQAGRTFYFSKMSY